MIYGIINNGKISIISAYYTKYNTVFFYRSSNPCMKPPLVRIMRKITIFIIRPRGNFLIIYIFLYFPYKFSGGVCFNKYSHDAIYL